jgi:hypothetical protein
VTGRAAARQNPAILDQLAQATIEAGRMPGAAQRRLPVDDATGTPASSIQKQERAHRARS